MKRGEKNILIAIVIFSIIAMAVKAFNIVSQTEDDPGIPYYSTASNIIQKEGSLLVREHNCRECHILWAQRTLMQSVPAPSLDGIGSLRTKEWLYSYFSSENPQSILPTRLKKEFQMPSYANLPESERELLAEYIGSLKVEDWYLEETKKKEYEKLTGLEYKP